MAGSKDQKKRTILKVFLQTKEGREMSDREVAEGMGCSRTLVKIVRFELIVAGLHPPVTDRKHTGDREIYKAGTVVRGGYVLDENAKVVRDKVYEAKKKPRGKPPEKA